MAITAGDLAVCYSLAIEAREILERADAMQNMAERCTPEYSSMPKPNSVTDKVGDGATDILDFWEERKETARSYLKHIAFVEKAIGELQDINQRRILRYRYIDGLLWKEIQLKTYYSERKVFGIYKDALKNLGIEQSVQ